MSSEFGNKIKLSIFGESHGEAIGCVIDSIPAGVKLDMEKIYFDMARRAPGKDKTATPRLEKDIPHILSGVLNGVTTGAPLAMIIENTNTKSGDYSNLLSVPRPSHSDYPAYVKYHGNNDIRGGGHFSGRLTAPLVFAGAIAKQILAQKGITVGAHILSINGVLDDSFDKANVSEKELLAVSSKAAVKTSRASLTCFPITGRISAETSFIPLRISVRDPFFPRTETRSSCNSFSFSAEICFKAASVSSRSAFSCSSIVDIFPPSWSIYRHRKKPRAFS